MSSLPPALIAATAVLCLGNLFHVIGLSTAHWVELDAFDDDGSRVKLSEGLFLGCDGIKKVCAPYGDDYPKALDAVRALVFLAMFSGLAGAVAALIFVTFTLMGRPEANSKIYTLGTPAASVVAFILIVIAVSVFSANLYEVDETYGYSFGLTIAGGILITLGGVLFFVGSKLAF